jgi:hypothetical protein
MPVSVIVYIVAPLPQSSSAKQFNSYSCTPFIIIIISIVRPCRPLGLLGTSTILLLSSTSSPDSVHLSFGVVLFERHSSVFALPGARGEFNMVLWSLPRSSPGAVYGFWRLSSGAISRALTGIISVGQLAANTNPV